MKDLRQRMIEDMKLRGLASNTQALYLHAITALAKHYRRRPDQITQEQIKDYLLYLTETKGYAKSTFKVHLFAIKFMYQKTLGRDWRLLQLARVRADKKLPIILSRDEVWELLDRVRRPEAHMSLTLMYTCGLRVSEAVNLRPEDIDSGRKVVWVRNGKGNKDRSVPLPVNTLAELRRYWRRQRPKRWLFPSKRGTTPISDGSVRRCLTAALWQSSINKKVNLSDQRSELLRNPTTWVWHMRNCAYRYIALSHHLSPARPLSLQKNPVPRNGRPTASCEPPETQRISCSKKYSSVSLRPSKSSTAVEKTEECERDPRLPHNALSRTQTPPLSWQISPLHDHVSARSGCVSYTSDTILNDTYSHKQHGSYFATTCRDYISVFPIEENTLTRFSSPTKGRSIQS